MGKKNESVDFELGDITIDDLVEFEEGDLSKIKFIRDFMGRFVSDGDGGVLKEDEGAKIIGSQKLAEIQVLTTGFRSEVERLSQTAVNPTKENESDPPSEEKT